MLCTALLPSSICRGLDSSRQPEVMLPVVQLVGRLKKPVGSSGYPGRNKSCVMPKSPASAHNCNSVGRWSCLSFFFLNYQTHIFRPGVCYCFPSQVVLVSVDLPSSGVRNSSRGNRVRMALHAATAAKIVLCLFKPTKSWWK